MAPDPDLSLPRPVFIDRFIGLFTFQMTGQVEDRFWDSRVRLPTKQCFLMRTFAIQSFFSLFLVGTVAERLLGVNSPDPKGIIVHKKVLFFHFFCVFFGSETTFSGLQPNPEVLA